MINQFLNILFPETCPVCGKPAEDHYTAPICPVCWQEISPYEGPACLRCGRPLISDASTTCGECLQDEPCFTRAAGFGLYKGVLRTAIGLMKYHNIKRLSKPLADILLSIDRPVAGAVIPVPLHERRLRNREFNQSALLAKYLAEGSDTELILNCLVKVRDTSPQVGLRSHGRRINIKDAFNVLKPDIVKGKKVMLIDDVVTTGATVRECSRILMKAGAENVYVLTLAHGMMGLV